MKRPFLRFLSELARVISQMILVIDQMFKGLRQVPRLVKSWAGSDYLIPGVLITIWLVLAGLALLPPDLGFDVGTAMALCGLGIGGQVANIYLTRTIAQQRRRIKANQENWENEKEALVDKAVDLKRALADRGRMVDTMQVQLERADDRYDNLLHARTDEIISEVHRRLAGTGEPVRHVFPDVPAAPEAPEGVADLPRPKPPF